MKNKNLWFRKICYTFDLVDNPEQYKSYHSKDNTWPEITKSIKDSAIVNMEVDESYTPKRKQIMDAANPKFQEWENLM